MDENDLQTDESEEENLRAMEKDIDEFLSSIRENTSTNTDLQNEGTYSKVSNEYDLVSSDDCFENEQLPSRSDDPGIQGPARKVHCRPLKNKFEMGKGNVKKYKKHSLQSSYSHEEWERHSGKSGQYSGDEHYDQRSFPRSWRDEYDPDMSPSQRSDAFHQERSLSPRGDYYQRRSFSQSRGNEHQNVRSISPNRKGNYRQRRWFIPKEGHRYKRRNFHPEEVDESSQDSSVFNERHFHRKRTIASLRSNDDDDDDDNESHRVHSRGSRSAIDWSESYDYDSDFEDQDSNQPWGLEEEYPYIEDRDDHNAVSFITACLQRAIAYNPAVATKVTEACMALLNKPTDGLDENAYEWDRDPYTTHEEESGRVSPQSWRSRRSPSFTESVGTSSSRSGFNRRSDRFHGHSEKRVSEHFINSDDRQAGRDKYNYSSRHKKAKYSPDHKRRDDGRPKAASEIERTRMRSASGYTKSHHDEEFNLKGAVSWSIRKIRKKCEAESSSTVRRALLALVEVHERECKMYMKKPEAHPDHRKEYREFVNQKTKSIIDLGGDPNGYDFEQDWKKYWPVQMYKLFQESWNTKMHSCTSLLKKKCRSSSKSSHSSSRKSAVKHPRGKRHKAHKQGSKRETVKVQENIKKTFKMKQELVGSRSNLEDLQSTETNAAMLCEKHEEINKEIFSILKLLNHIKHRFNDCEASFDKLYNKAMNLKEDNVAINDILQRNLPLLEKIDGNLSETLEDDNLTLIQKVVIQETLERFRSFLKKSKEMKSKEIEIPKVVGNTDKAVDGTEGEHQIPCHLTSSYPSVISKNCSKEVTVPLYASCSCCRTNQQVGQPRILTEISLQGSSGPQSWSLFTSKNASGGSLLLCHTQDKINFNNITSDVTSADQQASRPRRMLTEISLVGSSCPASSATDKHNVIMAGKDPSMTQPPPPGVTPPPPGVTPPPPGVTPPPPDVTPPPRVTSPPVVTSPPHGVTPPPSSGTLSPSGITPPLSVRLSPFSVTSQLPDVTSSCDTLPSSSISPTCPGITSSRGVTEPLPGVSAPPNSVITTSDSVTTKPHNVAPSSAATPPHYSVFPQTSSSTSDAALISRVTPLTPPGVSVSSDCLNSSVLTVSQAPGLGSPPSASVPQSPLANDKTHVASQHLPTKFTTLEQDCNPLKTLKAKVTGIASPADTPPQPSKEVLRTTIKDCFLSSTLPEETGVIKSTKEGVLTSDTATKGSSVASLPSLPEDFLKMFEVKPEDNCKVNSDDKSSAEMGNTGSSIKSTEKKPIKITIPQFSKQKSMLELNPITDDQEMF